MVTTETLVVAATALVTTSNTGSVADVNAILGKTSGIVTAAVTAGTASALDSTLTNATVSTTDALTLTLNDTTGVTITLLNSLNDKTSVNVVATSLTEVLGTTVGGGAAADTIDLNAAGITYHATDMISIKGGVGDDVLTGRANAPDTFVIGNTGADGQIITINNFNGTNDILSFFTDAILNVKMDSDDADGTQEIQATSFSNTGNATFTVKLMGLTNAQDANLFNMDSFNTLFGKTGRDGDDVITGTGGNDTITGGLGVDAMTGDAGDDTLIYALTADLFNTKAVVDTITGGDGIDVISVGTNGTTFAIANDDIWTRVNTVETIKAVANTEAVTIALSVSAETAGIRTVDLSLTSHPTGNVINVSTYSAATTLIGGSGADVITGGAGADVITGGLGVDAMTGDAGDDTLIYALTADLFNTKAVVDTITGGDGIDVISVGTNGTTFAIANDDIWTRVNTVETIKAVANTEAVTIALSVSAETAGIRTVDLSLTSHPTGNVINVSTYSAATTLIGGSGADVITGGAGADVITGGLGVDAMTGGASADTFVFAPGVTDTAAATSSVAGIDKITDLVLNAATADLIDLTVTVANVNTAIATGLANAATFVSDMNTLVNVGSSVGFNTGMNSDISAVLVTLNAGDQSGKTFLLVDLDGSDTFTATDFIIDVTGITATSVTTASFV